MVKSLTLLWAKDKAGKYFFVGFNYKE